MDLSLSTAEHDLRALTRTILDDHVSPTSGTASDFDLDLWRTLGTSGLIGVGLPEHVGGFGGGFVDACVVLEEVGRSTAPVPALAVMAQAGPTLARFGTSDDLGGVASGDAIVTAALHEPSGDVHAPALRVDDSRLTGVKICVAAGTIASRFLVSTSAGLQVVESDADGLTVERTDTTSGLPDARLTFDRTPCRSVAGPEGLAWLLDHAIAAQCVVLAGVAQRALELTAAYAKERQQFDRPIASFQAVSQRMGDARIDAEGIRLTAWHAAWRVAEGLPATEAVAVAKFWAADAGQRVVHAATHVHGGIGVDRSYPLHRCFLWAKQLELSLGGATPSLVRLGKLLAAEPVTPARTSERTALSPLRDVPDR